MHRLAEFLRPEDRPTCWLVVLQGVQNVFGAAPPEGHGEHRYVFALHAVSIPTLGLDASASPAYVGFTLTFNTIGRGVLIAHFDR